jgi:prepilin peptidase CpaA
MISLANMEPLYLSPVLLLILLVACVFDLRARRIPNLLILAGLACALVLRLWLLDPADLPGGLLAGLAVGLLMFLPMYLLGGMAAGDVKLMAMVGAFLGPALAFQCSLATYVCGGVLALAIIVLRGRARAAFANAGALLHPLLLRCYGVRLAADAQRVPSVGGMPYALAITAGTALVLYLRHS